MLVVLRRRQLAAIPRAVGHRPCAWGDSAARWSESKNVAWKTPIHGKGWSTPAVQDQRIWPTTATEDGKEFSAICLDRATGKILVDRKLFHCVAPEPLGNRVNTYASPSPLTDADRVFVHFGSYGTACLDVRTGAEVWRRTDLPVPALPRPGVFRRAVRRHHHSDDGWGDVQYLIALEKATGKTVWRTDRTTDFKDLGPDGKPQMEGDLRKAYTTPLLITPKSGEPWFISTGAKATYAYDAATGKERWSVLYDGFSNASSPVYSHGLAIINTGYGKANLRAYTVDDATRGRLCTTNSPGNVSSEFRSARLRSSSAITSSWSMTVACLVPRGQVRRGQMVRAARREHFRLPGRRGWENHSFVPNRGTRSCIEPTPTKLHRARPKQTCRRHAREPGGGGQGTLSADEDAPLPDRGEVRMKVAQPGIRCRAVSTP